jgi:hypothetical protein
MLLGLSVPAGIFVAQSDVWWWVVGGRIMLNYGICEMLRLCTIIGKDK